MLEIGERLILKSFKKDLMMRIIFLFDLHVDEVPMVYPYYAATIDLKKLLIKRKIFVATYWPNVSEWCPIDTWEYRLVEHFIAIPIDQRYSEKEMKMIIERMRS